MVIMPVEEVAGNDIFQLPSTCGKGKFPVAPIGNISDGRSQNLRLMPAYKERPMPGTGVPHNGTRPFGTLFMLADMVVP